MTEQQLNFFRTFGFITFRELLSRNEMQKIDIEFNRAIRCMRSAAQKQQMRRRISRFFMDRDTPFIASLGDDRRFAGTARQMLKRPVLCIHVAGAFYSGDTTWHSDNTCLEYSGVKFVIYLDRLSANNGALRVIPGSHRNPLWQESGLTADTETFFGVRPDSMPCYVFESKAGDALAFQHRLWHSSFNGGRNRRMIEINYYADPKTAREKSAFLTQMEANHAPSVALGNQMYPPYWRSMRARQHQRWIRRLSELGVLETFLASKEERLG